MTTVRKPTRRVAYAVTAVLATAGVGTGVYAWLRHKAKKIQERAKDMIFGDVPNVPTDMPAPKRGRDDYR